MNTNTFHDVNMQEMNVHDIGSQDDGSVSVPGAPRTSGRLSALNSRLQVGVSQAIGFIGAACQRKSVRYGSAALAVVLLIVTISVPVAKSRRSSDSNLRSNLSTKGPRFPTAQVDHVTQLKNKNEFAAHLSMLYEAALNTGALTAWSNEGGAAYHAMNWVTGRSDYADQTMDQRSQRYALAAFYYSTFMVEHDFLSHPTDWVSQNGWLSDSDECKWEGLHCNHLDQIIAINLPNHAVSGTLPIELFLLHRLLEIDLTTNYIYMEGSDHDVWNHLKLLRRLKMEDNFMVSETGLPTQFSHLEHLEKLQLSYNLLQGPLQSETIVGMQKLQHFEVESNYLTGDVPLEMGQLPSLIYFYARRNLMSINLPNMLVTGSYPSLFSLWLDNNKVFGSIPAVIGEITDLASLSITNATLSGPIPAELGNLAGLKRVWLYGNQLTGILPANLENLRQLEVFEVHANQLGGSMTSSICDSVSASNYQFKALTADCAELSCACCTECH